MSALRDLVGSGAECSGGNSLSQFTKQLQQDRSLQQERFGFPDEGGSSSSFGLRERPGMERGMDMDNMLGEFFEGAPPDAQRFHQPDVFSMNSLGKELERIGPQATMPVKSDWAVDFARQSEGRPMDGMNAMQFSEFEDIYQREEQVGPVGAPEAWAVEFHSRHHEMQGPHVHHEIAEFERAFEEAKHQVSWEAEFAKSEDPANWASEFESSQAQSWINEFTEQEGLTVDGATSKEALAQTAGMLLDAVENSANPKFRESKFLDFMKKLRDQEVSIEGNKVVEQTTPFNAADSWAQEFGASIKSQNWEEEFSSQMGQAGPAQVSGQVNGNPAMWAEEFSGKRESDWATEFGGYGPKLEDKNWTTEFERQQMERNWAEEFNKNMPADLDAEVFEDGYWNAWDNNEAIDQHQGRALGGRYEEYEFTANNPYLDRETPVNYRNLTEAILVLEAAVQKDSTNANAWYELGIRQQENENDVAAIAALRAAVRQQPSLTDAWIGLSVSYTNESFREDAYDALESWLMNSDKYQHILEGSSSSTSRHEKLTNNFLEAARQSAGSDLDADVQVGLGVLFHISEEYHKAVDCFEAALSKRPEDYLLWNKLGATLANSSTSDRAIDAYFHALEINPSYIRARYNLAICCMQMGQYREAAEHLLGALSVQTNNISSVLAETKGGAEEEDFAAMHNVQSSTVWSTLKMLADGHLKRHDLAQACERRDLHAFRADFDF
ncbi:uncharacterized protein SPPG_04205 [Spizellomyces punctatus DAOM BR117]|uniref:Uncharacterized protein n=1 Tax=Spizellomyces punctatus (strain DAOM BR117) TaxID=645134 RepID=A0A0L0HJR4_SPIPD|nr:uncharacterized protein SPPG_04205 [Spizellomyces punctatus DAOM BR117]KND01115.1 hypothetical protein SPPG_04205 [Spizellomyces punctatus DAOM BR117]|eukprot:XP_016609154.1 hypothetical protein SPPG_04205 [Spizellomyces punctatus DAOM BR117]